MFGIAVARLDCVTPAEQERYQALYCGLCRALKQRYGQVGRLALSYDLTFFVMLCDSLHEPPEETGRARCVAHPKKKMPFARSCWTDYAADLSVALAYHKCLDDVTDDGTVRGRAGAAALAQDYRAAERRVPRACAAIEAAMGRIRALEAAPATPPDACAQAFGDLLGQLFAHNQGAWEQPMRTFGDRLGRFVYLMDAAVDLPRDRASGSYNPFAHATAPTDAASLRTLLQVLAGDAAATFEKLPLERDVHLMRSVLYSGVWQKFNYAYNTEDGNAPTDT